MIEATKVEEYYVSPYADKDKAIFDSLAILSMNIDKKYNCTQCKYRNDCGNGDNCYIDYMEDLKRQGRKFPPDRLQKKYNYYYRDIGLI